MLSLLIGKVFRVPDNVLSTQRKRKQRGFPDVMLPKMSFGELCNWNCELFCRTEKLYFYL